MTSPDALLEMVSDLRAGRTNPSQVLADALERVRAKEPAVHAWVRVDVDGSAAQAEALETAGRHGPLWGIPVAVKDLIDVKGLPTGCGSPLRGHEPATADADCVRLLREAGAIIVGKTVTTEFGYFAPGPTRNPVNPAHTPGGSSSGSAAAVAAGMVPLALGTQTAGSLTRPASYCGVAGFVAAKDQFPTTGITGLSHSLDSLGLITRTVADLRYAWESLSRFETVEQDEPLGSVRLLLWAGSGLGELSREMSAALTAAQATLGNEPGFHFTDWSDHGMVRDLAEHHATVMASEASAARAEELAHHHELSVPFTELLTSGRSLPHHEYTAAVELIAVSRQRVLALLERFDAVLGPAALGAAPPGLEATGSPILSRPWQALGLPVLTIPGLTSADGMPLGLQLIGAPGREPRLFDIGQRIEEALRQTGAKRGGTLPLDD
ncbi:amidase [Arthrobacter sp. 2MCAF15]|uniref:amidase n=1 Tax=Arthrobacter sp. 2MCAF15 TaxID=3232984 RepID=UPI003F8EA491